MRQIYNLSDADADKCITERCFKQIDEFKSVLSCLNMIKKRNVRYCFLRRHQGETDREVQAQQEFITNSNELFKTFENKKLVHLPELRTTASATTTINDIDLTKYLHILRHKWPIISSMEDDDLIELLSTSFCTNLISVLRFSLQKSPFGINVDLLFSQSKFKFIPALTLEYFDHYVHPLFQVLLTIRQGFVFGQENLSHIAKLPFE